MLSHSEYLALVAVALWASSTTSDNSGYCDDSGEIYHCIPTSERMESIFGESERYQEFFFSLKQAVRDNERSHVAGMIQYPLNYYSLETKAGERSEPELISDSNEFLGRYDEIFDENMKKTIELQDYDKLFVRYDGVMIGRGQVWFSGFCSSESPLPKCENIRVAIFTINQGAPK